MYVVEEEVKGPVEMDLRTRIKLGKDAV